MKPIQIATLTLVALLGVLQVIQMLSDQQVGIMEARVNFLEKELMESADVLLALHGSCNALLDDTAALEERYLDATGALERLNRTKVE